MCCYFSQETVQREASELVTHLNQNLGKPLELTFELNVAVLNVIWQLVAGKWRNSFLSSIRDLKPLQLVV